MTVFCIAVQQSEPWIEKAQTVRDEMSRQI